jgi:glycosyltransferase involved in cell wall biosynthesis
VPLRPTLSVVVPVYDGAATIVENVETIRRSIEPHVNGEVELIVVSDGSIDETAEVLLESRQHTGARVIHYDRNLGKGYAVRAGALAARGDWVAFIDADLDLDPAAIPAYLEVAQRENLDLAIGSKRHPDSVVFYPRSRRVASWCYQKLNRLLFRLDVRDTQVGLKVFSREVAENVLPLLMVKQFAFDLELLAVAEALGYRRIRELPVRLDYRFTGSGVRSRAVLLALIDTAAIFYRVRILRTYQRKQRMLRHERVNGARGSTPLVTLVGGDSTTTGRLDYSAIEVADTDDRIAAARSARGELLAFLAPGARPGGNWLSAAAAFFVRHDVAAVVVPSMAPRHGSLKQIAAAAILESRLGAGSRRIRYSPGNVRLVVDYPAANIVVRRRDYLEAAEAGVPEERLVTWLTRHGREVVYTPETMVVDSPAPLFLPHLRAVAAHAASRGGAMRVTHGRSLDVVRLVTLLPFLLGVAGLPLIVIGGTAGGVGVAFELVYGAALLMIAVTGAFRFHSLRAGALAAPGALATHVTYVVTFLAGAIRRR